jgi:protein TonB
MMKYQLSTLAKILGTAALACTMVAAHASPKLIKRVPPEFPREAVQASVDSGVVKAKMSIDADGKVTEVTIVEAQPRRADGVALRGQRLGAVARGAPGVPQR